VPRIRSIKPEFFTSETLAKVSISARLTFIGLWTYVDDNGVGIDNDRLIAAALYPLDDNPLEALRRVSEDLRQLSAVGVISRYAADDRKYLFISNWVEHQKVSHPGKPRYPRPSGDWRNTLNSDDAQPSGEPPADLGRSSVLSREQGAGSREGKDSPSSAGADDASNDAAAASKRTGKRPKRDTAEGFDAFWKAYPLRVGKIAAEKAYEKALDSGATAALLAEMAAIYALECRGRDRDKIKHPQGWLNDGRWQDEAPDRPPAPREVTLCPEHRLPQPCRSCAADAKAAPDEFRPLPAWDPAADPFAEPPF
jgi:hypothetical protein